MTSEDDDKAYRARALERMRWASDVFYSHAADTGCHAFLEFTGLMNEFIQLCQDAEAAGKPWLHANVHSGEHLRLEPWHRDYVREKLACIYGPGLGIE